MSYLDFRGVLGALAGFCELKTIPEQEQGKKDMFKELRVRFAIFPKIIISEKFFASNNFVERGYTPNIFFVFLMQFCPIVRIAVTNSFPKIDGAGGPPKAHPRVFSQKLPGFRMHILGI